MVVTERPLEASEMQAEAPEVILEQGVRAFTNGDFAEAARWFQRLEKEYADEPVWRESPLPQRLLPLKGFSELRGGMPAEAAETLAVFLEKFPHDLQQRAFVLFARGLALRMAGQPEDAIAAFASFRSEFPQSGQSVLAALQMGEIHREKGDSSAAIGVFLDAWRENRATRVLLAGQARLRALQIAVEEGSLSQAFEILTEDGWQAHAMPEMAVLCFAALRLGDRLLTSNRPEDALRAYRWVVPRTILVAAQRERIAVWRLRLQERASLAASPAGAVWLDFYFGLVRRMEDQLVVLESMEDYTAGWQLRRAQAFLLAGRSREAWLLAERLALEESLPLEMREEAHYRWILAAVSLERWEEALAISRSFLASYPDSRLAPEAFLLIGRAHLEQRRFPEAAEVLSHALVAFPDHPARPQLLFQRGFVQALMEQFQEARSDFRLFASAFPQASLAVNARFWYGLTHFFERSYALAREQWERLQADLPVSHPMYPEISYRMAMAWYAGESHGEAASLLEILLRDHGLHPRAGEARVLLGDIYMGQARLEEALAQFQLIEPGLGSLYEYAIFQVGKIHRAQGHHADMVDHFRRYLAEGDPPLRAAEALHWVSWALDRMDRTIEAVDHFLQILELYGNDVRSGDFGETLELMDRLDQRLRRETPGWVWPGGFTTFPEWAETQAQIALQTERFVLLGRWLLYLSRRAARQGQPYRQQAYLLELANSVPLTLRDPESLSATLDALLEIRSPSAREAMEFLLSTYPNSPHRVSAYRAQAVFYEDQSKDEEALRWLSRIIDGFPTHRWYVDSLVRRGQLLLRMAEYEESLRDFDEVLRLRSARGRPQAVALVSMGHAFAALGDPARAIGCFQRVYTMHRAQTDLVAESYYKSAREFLRLGEITAVRRSLEEMLRDDLLRETSFGPRARALLETLPEAPEVGNDGTGREVAVR